MKKTSDEAIDKSLAGSPTDKMPSSGASLSGAKACDDRRLDIEYDPFKDVLRIKWGRKGVLNTAFTDLTVGGTALRKSKGPHKDLGLTMVEGEPSKRWQYATHEIKSPSEKHPKLFPAGEPHTHEVVLLTVDRLPQGKDKYVVKKGREQGWSFTLELTVGSISD